MLTPEEQAILDLLVRVAREKIEPMAAAVDREERFPEESYRLLRELGLIGCHLPEQYGGGGLRLLVFCRILEEIAKKCANSANILSQQDFAAAPILLAGTAQQKQRHLPALARGEKLAAFALTEPNAGSDVSSIETRAELQGESFVINGSKQFITWGNMADVITVFCKTNPSRGHKGISAILAEKGTPGLSVGRLEKKLGMNASPTAQLIFEDCRVPRENLLGQIDHGFTLAMKCLERGRVGVAAMAVGLAQGAIDFAARYARERKQFGKSIAEFQAIQFIFADMATAVEASRQLLYRACEEGDRGGPDANRLSAMAKLLASDSAMEVTTNALQVLGGYGYLKDFPLERMFRDAKVMQIVEGTNQIQRLIIGREVLFPKD
ncbi:MAG: acyl-CoA dehydrogenase family protein [Deltaproteobacteria bacterium]|nr:acyl-CoA dehydrogenase family protein [Deltaproteobacteria bacterium]